MIRLLIIAIFVILSFGCWKTKSSFESINSNEKDTIIVFLDIKNYSRLELSQIIKHIDSFDPKIIALSVQFDSLKEYSADSILASSILNSSKVILSSTIKNLDRSLMRSDPKFSNAALTEGVLSYLVDKDSVTTQFIPLFQNATDQMASFPHAIAFNFDPSTIGKFEDLKINSVSNINYQKNLEDFFILDETNLKPELIRDKIVIFGSLDTNESCYFIKVKGMKKKVPSVVVTANIILDILSNQ